MTLYELQLRGYRLTTAEIVYRLPDHPALLQTFIWQKFDLAPEFPELQQIPRVLEAATSRASCTRSMSSRAAARRPTASAMSSIS